jgi:hypothetical protein
MVDATGVDCQNAGIHIAYGFAGMGPYSGGQAQLLRVPYADFNCLKLPEDADEKEKNYVMLSDIFPTGWHATRLAALRCNWVLRARFMLNWTIVLGGEVRMARYGKKAGQKVKRALHERKTGSLRSGRSKKKVKSRKQAIAIGLSEARQAGAKVPRKKSSARKKK